MTDDMPIYMLIQIAETAPVFDDAPDNDVAIEAIYHDHLQHRLAPLGITIVETEIPGWFGDGSRLIKAVTKAFKEAAP